MPRKMKDSGIEWIGEIPETWEVTRLKALFSFGKGLPITKENLVENGVPVISYGQIHSKSNSGAKVQEELIRYVPEIYLESGSNSLVHQNDFIFADTSEDLDGCGNCVFVDREMQLFAGYHTIIFRSKNDLNNKYLAYLFKTDEWRSQIRSRVSGVKLFSISRKILSDSTVILPPPSDQHHIASYLDTQCAKIDAVLEQTRNSIEEYKKLKQSVITQAVTKGIRPGRKMKDSGIEWIGLMPDEWESINPKALFYQRKEKAKAGERQLTASQQYGVIFQDEYMERTGSKIVTVEKDFDILKHVEAGDFVISMRSFQGGLEYSTNTGSISSAYVMLQPNLELVFPRFFRWLLKSSVYINALQSTSNMVRDGQAMRYSNFAQVRLFTLPLGEQEEIADYLDSKCLAMDRLIEQKQRFLKELESYKKSMIYECVTGKREVISNSQEAILISGIDLKAIVAMRIIELMGNDLKGRVHLQKALYLFECMTGLCFNSVYVREKHGPMDRELTLIENLMQQKRWCKVIPRSPYQYVRLKGFETYRTEYEKHFSVHDQTLIQIVEFIRKMKTSQAERVATLMAAWNDFLIEGKSNPSDHEIIEEIRTNWHERKAHTPESTWQGTLDKMKRNGIVPHGYGKHTIMP